MDICGNVSAWRTFGSCNSAVAVPWYVLPTRDTPSGPEQPKIKLFYWTFADMEKDRSWVCESSVVGVSNKVNHLLRTQYFALGYVCLCCQPNEHFNSHSWLSVCSFEWSCWLTQYTVSERCDLCILSLVIRKPLKHIAVLSCDKSKPKKLKSEE